MSFLDKLKKGMGASASLPEPGKETDEPGQEKDERDEDEKTASAEKQETAPPPQEKKIKTKKAEASGKKPAFEVKPIPSMITKESFAKENKEKKQENQESKDWLESEGQLAVDVFQTENDLVVLAAIAGMKVEDLDVIIEEEIITIKGARKNPFLEKPTGSFIEECYWGPFSRKIILPLDADSGRADASMKDGILTIRIPKILRDKKRKVSIRE
jgi:HSP20 family protein